MVLLHAIEHGATWPRVRVDLDVIVNARVRASVRGFVTEIEALGFVLDGMDLGRSPDANSSTLSAHTEMFSN